MISVEINYPKINMAKTEDAIHEHMTEFVINALKVWVLHTVQPIPVWSGAARASFLQLAAEARTSIEITPIAPSRILLGLTEATSEVIVIPGKEYGWTWHSNLIHLPFVQDRVGFIEIGLASIANLDIELPNPIFES